MSNAKDVIRVLTESQLKVVIGSGTLVQPVATVALGTKVDFVFTSNGGDSILRVKGTGAWTEVKTPNLEDYIKDIELLDDKFELESGLKQVKK